MRNESVREAISHWDWPAIAAGVVVAVAVMLLLSWLGSAFALSVGDERPESGFAVWMVIVQLGAVFVGAAFAAYLARVASTTGGLAIGAFTWALALVLGSTLTDRMLPGWRLGDSGDAAWALFLGALLSLASALVGGAFGATRLRGWRGATTTRPTPVAP